MDLTPLQYQEQYSQYQREKEKLVEQVKNLDNLQVILFAEFVAGVFVDDEMPDTNVTYNE